MPDLIVFDADGTLRETTVAGQPCPHADGEWVLLPGVAERLRRIDWSRVAIGVASNQDHVGYGLLRAERAGELLEAMLSAAIGRLPERRAIRFCPHPEANGCGCRKPAPGLLLAIGAALGIPPARALFVGDAAVDRTAAAAAGMPFAWAWDFFGRPAPASATSRSARSARPSGPRGARGRRGTRR